MRIAFHFYSGTIIIFNPTTGNYVQEEGGRITDHGIVTNEKMFATIIELKLYGRFRDDDSIARIETLTEGA